MGSYGDSQVLRDAVAYAAERGVVLVAAAGNNGINRLAYPAAYEGVISVGSVDARGERLDFSNQSWGLDVVAPGYALDVAWPGSKIAEFTGTSASAPIVSGAIAATMSEQGLRAKEAAAVVLEYLNEAGAAGADAAYGGGIVDVGRVMAKDEPGIHDAALASQSMALADGTGQVEVVVQNRGTETITAALVTVNAAGREVQIRTGTIEPGGIEVRKIAVGDAAALSVPGATLQSSVALGGGQTDANRGNDTRKAQVADQ
jgi:subtilisin family serine protease